MTPINLLTNPVGSTFVRFVSKGLPLITASEQSGRVGALASVPKTLTYRNWPVKGAPLGFVAGVSGLPRPSTTAIVGFALPGAVGICVAFPLFQPSKYRKIPLRAHGVSTIGFWFVRML